jgi:hypothetical protein
VFKQSITDWAGGLETHAVNKYVGPEADSCRDGNDSSYRWEISGSYGGDYLG